MTPAPAMDRRDVLKLGGAAALALLAPDAVAAAARASSLTPSTIVVADPRYRESLIFAGSLERHGAKVVTLASDRAATWFGAIAPQLPHGLHRLTGLTLESDLFILERLAESSGAHTCYAGLHDWRCRSGVGHTLSGTIDLDPIAAALRQWQGRMGGRSWRSACCGEGRKTGGAEASAQMRGTVRPRPAILRLLADALGGLAES